MAAAGLAVVSLVACCPVTAPPPTAFVARLQPLGGGRALAQLADGRQLDLIDVPRAPTGWVYVSGRLLVDGRVEVTALGPLAGSPRAP